MYRELKFKIEGVSPLMVHNGQLADPLNPHAKELKKLSSQRKKTDETHEAMSRVEWFGGLYLNEKGVPVIPGECIERMLVDAAKKKRMGKEFTSAIICDGVWEIEFDGPRDLEQLFKTPAFVDRRKVKVQNSSVMRTRPIFHKWALKFGVHFLPSVVNEESVKEVVGIAGQLIGLGDYRPRYGRFNLA
jgi:hypothetical protein